MFLKKFLKKDSQKIVEKTNIDGQEVIQLTVDYVKSHLQSEASGHDWWHVYRVWKLSKYIAAKEGADLFVVQLAALLHDIADWKFYGGDEEIGPETAKKWLNHFSLPGATIDHICQIIKDISFKGAGVADKMESAEGKIVQDADRLDAIGAIGIARCFAYGGNKNNPMHDPQFKPKMHNSSKEYFFSKTTSINHFYEKLFLLKDRINTQTGKKIAEKRHTFMKQFLDNFFLEWEAKDVE